MFVAFGSPSERTGKTVGDMTGLARLRARFRKRQRPRHNCPGALRILEHETGFEPATLTLATGKKAKG